MNFITTIFIEYNTIPHNKYEKLVTKVLQRVKPDCEPCLYILRNSMNDIFLPDLFQGTVNDSEKQLFSLPARHSGSGIHDPLSTAVPSFKHSRRRTPEIVEAIKGDSMFQFDHMEHL